MHVATPILAAIAAIALNAIPTLACAAPVTIGFEGVVADNGAAVPTAPYSEGGFTLTNAFPTNNNDGIFGKDASNSNGSATFVFCSFDSACTDGTAMLLTGSSPFSLDSIDVGNWNLAQVAGTMDLIGTLFGGGTITTTLSTGDAWTTNTLSGFANLVSVEFRGRTTYAVAFDNLVLNSSTVPEPGSLALVGVALAGLSLRLRKQA